MSQQPTTRGEPTRAVVTLCGARLVIEATAGGIVAVTLAGGRPHPPPAPVPPTPAAAAHANAPATARDALQILAEAIRQLEEYFAGRRWAFSVPLSLERVASDFQRRVLQACAQIPYGQTSTYAQLAQRVAGTRAAARAVGRALATNPLPIFIPCHRLLRSDGALGGFGWGLEWKEFLLRLEGALG